MSEAHFRILLGLLAVVLLAQILYAAPRSIAERAEDRDRRFGWIENLSPSRRGALVVALLAIAVTGLVGLVGMFFFVKAAAIFFLVATIIVEVGSRLLFKGAKKLPFEQTLADLVTVGSVLVLYVALIGPAKELFQ